MLHLLSNLAIADYILVKPYGRDKPAGPYEKIAKQKANQQQESNLTNQQDEFRKDKDGTRVDLWPCRGAPPMAKPHVFKRGQVIPVETQSNNMHAGYIEYNIFRGTQVHQALAPSKSGAGFARAGTTITIPQDFPACGVADKCFLQFYFFSAEPRNYVTCSDFVLEGDVPGAVAETDFSAPGLKKRQAANTTVATNPTTVKTALKPIKPYSDAKIYSTTSVNYEGYAGQSDQPPASAMQMWNLTIPGEVGQDAVKLGLMTKEEAGLRKDFRKTIVTLTKAAESVVKKYQKTESKALAATVPGKNIMMENKGKADENGYYPAAKPSAYTAKLSYKPTPGETYTSPQALTILSDPSKREDTTTYIHVVGKCMDALQASVSKLEKTNVLAKLGEGGKGTKGGDIEAEKAAIVAACEKDMGTPANMSTGKTAAPIAVSTDSNPDDTPEVTTPTSAAPGGYTAPAPATPVAVSKMTNPDDIKTPAMVSPAGPIPAAVSPSSEATGPGYTSANPMTNPDDATKPSSIITPAGTIADASAPYPDVSQAAEGTAPAYFSSAETLKYFMQSSIVSILLFLN